VLVTSALCADTPADRIDLLAGAEGRVFRVRTPRLDLAVNGAGDCIAALFLVHYARAGSAAAALGAAAASVYGLLKRTAQAGSREILTVAAQDEYVNPSETFTVEAV
jgi:pyridoxine kinase